MPTKPKTITVPSLSVGTILQSLLVAFILFLAGWVWKVEGRVTTLEVRESTNAETLREIRADVKELLKAVGSDRLLPEVSRIEESLSHLRRLAAGKPPDL